VTACVGLFSLAEFLAEVADLDIAAHERWFGQAD
jgi:hypothetical protein